MKKIILILIIALMTASTIPQVFEGIAETTSNVTPLYNKTQAPLPQDLPWYFIVVIGDNRPKAVAWVQLPQVFYDSIKEISMINPQALIGLGDHVGQGSRKQYEEFYKVMNSSDIINQMYAMGNHDVAYGMKAWQFWKEYMGPYTIIYDGIPGWRILLLSSEAGPDLWNQTLENAYSSLGNRHMIVGFHRPVKPYVHHNLQDDYKEMSDALLNYMKEYGRTPLVLQAHWHGWAEYHENGTDWLIVGSLGAPLYSTDSCEAAATCVSNYHYLVLVLYPDGRYEYTPVLAGENSGNLTVEYINQTTVLVKNTKVDVYGNPADLPVRVEYEVGSGRELYQLNIVMIVPKETIGYIRLVEGPSGLKISSNISTSNSYIYIIDERTGEEITVYSGEINGLDLSQWIPGSPSTITTSSSATTIQTENSGNRVDPTVIGAVIVLIVLIVAVYFIRR